ncbi:MULTISPECIES: porin [Burkholderia]|uniref:Porin n=1 Tax=Burkholderia aenigmatica TaxID=2015348 RepID=A0A6J5J2U9_9BURK|nr:MULTISPECIES: porin [Burkholderia]CAB3965920.1 porin [Burkholderia aenigmatica]
MKHQRAVLLAALASICAPACAQSTITLYGIVDTGVEFFTHASPTGGAMVRLPTISGGDLPSRWGLRGEEDLGGGIKTVFTLESGFSPASGTSLQNGRLFGRQSFVGLKGAWGQLTVGRQMNMTMYGMADADVIGPAAFSMGSFDGYLAAARADNSVEYRGKFADLTVGVSYSFGRDGLPASNCGGQLPGDTMSCRALTTMLKYDRSNWGAALIYDEQRGGAGATAMTVVPGLSGVAFGNSGDTDRRYQANGYFLVGKVKVGGGWLHREIKGDVRTVRTDLSYLGVSVPYVAWVFDAQVLHVTNRSYDADGTMGIFRANYNLSKRTALYGLLAYMKNSGHGAVYSVSSSSLAPAVPAPGVGQAGAMVGIRHLF